MMFIECDTPYVVQLIYLLGYVLDKEKGRYVSDLRDYSSSFFPYCLMISDLMV